MGTPTVQCNDCLHKGVCKNKERYSELASKYDIRLSKDDEENFVVVVVCSKHYLDLRR